MPASRTLPDAHQNHPPTSGVEPADNVRETPQVDLAVLERKDNQKFGAPETGNQSK